jgi:RNA polymerase sigma-70 factor (ECF subfamily)
MELETEQSLSSTESTPSLGLTCSLPDELTNDIYKELYRIAHWHIHTIDHHVSLNPSDLVHEALARIASQEKSDWDDRTRLIAIASLMARRVLMNHIRAKKTQKRQHTASSMNIELVPCKTIKSNIDDLLALDEALSRLEAVSHRQSRIVELKYFSGLSTQSIAIVLGVSARTVQIGWNHASLWLARELSSERANIPSQN